MDVELIDIASISSTLISAVALVFTANELRIAHSSREMEGVFLLWDRYERYVDNYTRCSQDPEASTVALIHLLNFLENSALIYYEARNPRLVKKNIKALLDGYIELIEAHGSFTDILDHFGTAVGNYEELRKYYKSWRSRK